MKSYRIIAVLLFVAVAAWGCQSDSVNPKGDAKDQPTGMFSLARPQVQCGPSAFSRIKDGSMDLGGVEILNNSSDLYLILSMNPFKFVEEVKVFRGDATHIPLDADGNVSVEGFGYQAIMNSPMNSYIFTLPLANSPSCADIAIWARISTRSPFGGLVSTNYAWMEGAPVANGFKVQYCAPLCVSGATTNSSTN